MTRRIIGGDAKPASGRSPQGFEPEEGWKEGWKEGQKRGRKVGRKESGNLLFAITAKFSHVNVSTFRDAFVFTVNRISAEALNYSEKVLPDNFRSSFFKNKVEEEE